MARLKFRDFLVEDDAPSAEETLRPGPVRAIRDADQEKLLLKKREVTPVYKDDRLEILRLRGRDAAIYYGSGTHWGHSVSTDETYFDDYMKKNDPHLILTVKGRKFLVYPTQHGIYNEAYREQNAYELVQKFPELKRALNELGKKHRWPALMLDEPSEEDFERVRKEGKFSHLDFDHVPPKILAAWFNGRPEQVTTALDDKMSYEKAVDLIPHSDEGYMTRFLQHYQGKRGRDPVVDAYHTVKDDQRHLKALASAVFLTGVTAPLPQEVEVSLLKSLDAYDIDKVLKNLPNVKLSDAGWEAIVEKNPDEVIKLHAENKSLVPQKWLQRAQWQQFKKKRG